MRIRDCRYAYTRAIVALLLLGLFALVPTWGDSAFGQQGEADILLTQATLAYDDRDFPKALDLIDQALRLDPQNARALYYKGLVFLEQKKPDLAVPPLEAARQLRPSDLFIRYQLGIAYFALGQYDRAQPLFSELWNEQPGLDGLGFYVGFLRYRQKDYDGAVQAFKQGRATDPNLKQLSAFYKGLSLGVLGMPDQAVAELDQGLSIQASDPLSGASLRLRDSLATARVAEKRLKLELSVGGFYNDNVAVNPNPSSDAFAESLRTRSTASTGILIAGRGDYSWYRSGPIEATVTYSYFQTLNLNGTLSQYDVQDHLVGTAAYYRGVTGSMPYQIGLSYTYDYLFLNMDGFLSRHSPMLTATLVENTNNLTTALVRFQQKTFLREGDLTNRFPATSRDALNWMGGLTHVLRFKGDRHFLSAGYQYDVEDAKGSDFSYSGHRLLVGGLYTLPWGDTRLRYDYQVHWRDYRSINATFPLSAPGTIVRGDTEQIHFARIEKPLPYNFTVSAQYQRIQNDSNLAVYAYTQNTFSIVTTWNY
jgi:tetratricopeptide (TPR) repeat protein